MADYFYAVGGQQAGPVSFEHLQQLAQHGQLSPEDLVWTQGMTDWAPASAIAGLFSPLEATVVAPPPPPAPPGYASPGYPGAGGVIAYQQQEIYYPPGLQPVSFPVYLGLTLGSFVLMFGGAGLAQSDRNTGNWLMGLGLIVLIGAAVYGLMILYRAWLLIPPNRASTKPGLAVGLLLVPLFNLYWIFVAYWGWSKDYNTSVRVVDPEAPAVGDSLALTMCIFTVLGAIPLCGGIFMIVALILMLVFMSQVCAAVNHGHRRSMEGARGIARQ